MSDTYQPIFDAVRTSLRNTDVGDAVAGAIRALSLDHHAAQIEHALTSHALDVRDAMLRPSVLYRPSIGLDGNQWCAIYGDNLQDGVAGFGDTPELAMADFDKQWASRLHQQPTTTGETP